LKVETIILAGGYSSRMGMDKALIGMEGVSTIEFLIRKLTPFSKAIHVILGRNYQTVAPLVTQTANAIFNSDHHLGMFSSIKAGFKCISADAPILLQMIDQPSVPVTVYQHLLSSLDTENLFFQPLLSDSGEKGHPVILSPKLKDIILEEPSNSTLRDVLQNIPLASKKWVPVRDIQVLQNMNTPLDRKQWSHPSSIVTDASN